MISIEASTISDAWGQLLYDIVWGQYTYKQVIDRGSFAGDSNRLQVKFVSAKINHPLADFIPTVPDGVAPPTTMEYVEEYYCNYIMGASTPSDNEQYTYASRIQDQLPKVMEMLKENHGTNQASIIVGRPEDVDIKDPACLRLIDFKVVDGKLDITTFWRSHDLWAGFPANLGAMAMLQRDVAEYAGVGPGDMYYSSSGLHIYDYQLNSVMAKLGN